MIENFINFNNNLLLESLIMESQIHFSEKFVDILKQISKNKIAKEVLKIHKDKLDKNFTQNYIDAGSQKDEATFTADRKAKEFFGKEGDIKYKVVSTDRYLTHASVNNYLYKELGYEKPDSDPWSPMVGTVGIIKAEAKSNRSDKVYAWFETEDGRRTVINKSALVNYDDKYNQIWSLYRSNIKVGRLMRSILNAAEVSFTDKEMEEFVNSYKSSYDIMSNAFLKFDLVKGNDIAYWYDSDNYESEDSTLGSSCMANVDSSFFKLYTKNKNCSLLILYSDNKGKITDGKYTSSKIKGRALVWQTKGGDVFMDRVYTNNDSDVELFKKYAYDKGWWCKTHQNSSRSFSATNGKSSKAAEYIVELEKSEFTHYPYVDTLSLINFSKNIISNSFDSIGKVNGELNDTDGWYEEHED
jgi:hypothetical protein